VSVSCAEIRVSPGDSPEYACHVINLNYFLAIAYLKFLFAYDGLTCCFALLVTIDVFLVQWSPYSMVSLMDIASVLGLVSCGRHPQIDPWLVVFHCFSLAKPRDGQYEANSVLPSFLSLNYHIISLNLVHIT
jgi:hypothetical protein